MKRNLFCRPALLLAAALALCPGAGCQGVPVEPASPAPGGGAPAVPGPAPSVEAGEELALSPALGVAVVCFPGWDRETRFVQEGVLPLGDGRAVVLGEESRGDVSRAVCLDLASGRQYPVAELPQDGFLSPMPGEPDRFRFTGHEEQALFCWGEAGPEELSRYAPPGEVLERTERPGGGHAWDAAPELDLLAWADGEGLWLSAADGSGARLAIPAAEAAARPEFAALAQEAAEHPDLAFRLQSPRLMNRGRSLVAEVALAGSQMGRHGLAVLDIPTGETAWHGDVFFALSGENLDYLGDAALLAGQTRIDLTDGSTQRAVGHDLTEEFAGISADFENYFAVREDPGGGFTLVAYPRGEPARQTKLLGVTGAGDFQPLRALEGRVLCRYRTKEESGLVSVAIGGKKT